MFANIIFGIKLSFFSDVLDNEKTRKNERIREKD